MAYAFVRNSETYVETRPISQTFISHYGHDCRKPLLHITLKADQELPPSIQDISLEDVPPCERVLGTTELHEQIMLSLPWRSIFRAQAVSKSWRNITQHSLAIRQALFQVPAKPAMVWTLVDKEAESPTGPGGSAGGLLGPAAGLSELHSLMRINEADEIGVEYLVQAKINGIVPYRHLHFSQRLDSSHAVWSFCNHVHPDGLPAETALSTNVNNIKRMHPAYRNTFLSQPPSKVVEVGVYGGRSEALIEKIMCEDAIGITFQHVLDAVEKLQAARGIACSTVALWMKDVSFVRRKQQVEPAVTIEILDSRLRANDET